MKATFFRTIAVSVCLLTVSAQAGVIVDTSLALTQLQIIPASGSLQIQSPFVAGAFAQAQDSLGGFDQQFNSVNDTSTSAAALAALANANSAASVAALTLNSASAVNIGVDASASSSAQAALGPAFGTGQGLFRILDGSSGTNPVDVTFKATLNINQFLQTNFQGLNAFSEVIFQLQLADLPDQPLLFFDNPITIGPSSTSNFASSPTLTGTVTLETNTLYTLIAEVDSESSGLNEVPEPSLLLLDGLGAGMVGLFLVRRRYKRA
jgi:hypothetical protein